MQKWLKTKKSTLKLQDLMIAMKGSICKSHIRSRKT